MARANPYRQKNDRGYCTCGACGRRFTSLSGFDAHRVRIPTTEYDWRCSTDEELGGRGLVEIAGTWRSAAQNPRFASHISTEPAAGGRAGVGDQG